MFWSPDIIHLGAEMANDRSRLLLEATRCWRQARDRRVEPSPALFALLRAPRDEMLAPALIGLFRLFEAALGRKMQVGQATAPSEDEQILVDLVEGVRARKACLQCQAGVGSALDCAICSAQAMLRMARS